MKSKLSLILAITLLTNFLVFGQVKQADLAGSWYPADKEELAKLLKTFLDKAQVPYPQD